MQWAEISVETTPQAQDAVSNLMMENGCGGTMVQGEAPVVVTCYFPVDDRIEDRLLRIKSGINDLPKFGLEPGSREITVKYAEDDDWAEAWKQSFRTIRVGKHLVVKPTWEKFAPKMGDIVLELDPGMAFGTGYHPSTKLCLELLEKYMKPRNVVVDFGTGSGILAIAAAKLRASLVIAFDMDEATVQVARKNVVQNGLEESIEVHMARDPGFINLQADLVTANLIAEIIMAHADDFARLLRTGGILIASGVVKDRSLEVEQSLRNTGFDIVESPTEDEWVAIVAKKA